MKNERKPKTPVIAAHTDKDELKPAPKGKNNGRKGSTARAAKRPEQDISTLPLQNPYPVMRLGEDGQRLFGNPAAVSLLGFSEDQSIPESWREMIRRTLESGSSREMDIEHDGRTFSALFVPVQQAGYVNIYCRDITDQKQAQLDLQRSEERFRQAADAAGALVYEVDLLSGATAVVYGLERVAGYDAQSLAPTSDWWHSLIHPDDLALHLSQLDQLLASGGTDVCEYRLLHKNGNWISVQDNRLVIQDQAGQHVRLIGAVTDITGRKLAEEKLRANEAELQGLIDQTPFMLTRCTRDLRYRFVSRAYAEMLGRKPEDVAGRPIVEIMGEEGFNSISPYMERVLNGERVEYEAEISFKDVGIRSLHVVYAPDRDDLGNVVGWFGSITDVSTRKDAEQERNRALQREQWQREIAEHAWVVAEEARGRAEQELSERKLTEAALGTWSDAALPNEARPLWQRYGMALVATAIAILVRQLLDPLMGASAQYLLLLGAVAFSIWYGGVGPAIFSLLLGYVGITWLLEGWQLLLAPDLAAGLSFIVLLLSGTIVILLGETMRRAQRHAHQSAGLAVKRQREAEIRLIEQQRAEQALRASEQRFRDIFESAGVSVWVEDFSGLKMMIEDLHAQGITDFHTYFLEHPDVVRRAVGMVNILDVNQETLDLYGAASKDQLLGPLSNIFVPGAELAFLEELEALTSGQEMWRSETDAQSLDGRPISILLTVHFGPRSGDHGRVIVTVTDITERKQMEQALRASEEKYRRIVETANEGIWEIDADTCTTFVNARMAEMLGYSAEEMLGRSSFDFVFPEDNPTAESRLDVAKRGQPNPSSEFRFRRKDGSAVWALLSSSPRIDERGNFLGSVAMMVDITQRKQMEEDLARERELFKRLFETMPVMSTIYDPETRSILINKEIEKLTGWKQEEVTVESLLHALYPDPDYMREVLGKIAAAASTHEWVEVKIHTRDGRVLDTLWANISIMNGDKLITGISLGIDITERKRMADAIRKSEERYRALVSQATAGIAESDMQSRLTFVNPRFCEMLGYTEAEVLGKTIWELTYTDDVEQNKFLFQRMLDDGKPYDFEKRFVRKDGSHVWTSVSVSPIHDVSGTPRGGVGVIVDINERKRMEDALHLENQRFMKFIDSNIVGIVIGGPNGELQLANDYYLNLLGVTRQEFDEGKVDWKSFTPAEWLPADERAILQLQERGVSEPYEKEYERRDGTRVPVYVANALLPGRGNEIAAFVLDNTDRKRAERSILDYARQQGALFQLAEQLQHSYTPPEIYTATLDAILDALHCERASILLFDESDRMHFVAWRGLSDAYRQATDGHSPWTKDEVNPQPIYFNDIDHADLSEELKSVVRQEGIRSLAFIPLVPNGKLIGKFMVYFNSPHTFTDAELDLSLTIARQLAFDIARKRAESEVRRSAEYYAFRATLSDALRPLIDPEKILSEALRILGEKLNVDRVIYSEIDKDDETIVVLGNHVKDKVPEITGRAALADYGKSRYIFSRGQNLVVNDTLTSTDLDEKDRAMFLTLAIRSGVGIPLIKENRWSATLGVHHGEPRNWSRHEVALIAETAERIWASLERARSQESLRASEALYRTIARSIPGGGVYVVDKDMRYLVAEGPVTEAFGLSRQMLEGRTVMEIFPDERGVRMAERLRRNFAGETLDFETSSNGRVYWTQQAPLYDSLGQVIILTLDITERKRAEDALRNSEERMRLAIESHRMVAWEWDAATDVVTTSANFHEVYGLSAVSTAAEGFALIWPEDLPAHQEKVNQVMRAGGEYHSEFRITRPADGRLVWMEERATAIMDAHGKVSRLVGIVIDVTERKEADENLRLSEQRLRMATEAAGMFSWDVETATGKLHWSENAADVIGCRPEDLPDHMDGSRFFMPPEDDARVLREYEVALEQKSSTFTTEFRGQGDAQTAKHFLMHARILYDRKGRLVRVLGVTQDITRRKQAEQELKAAREHAEQTADRIARLQEITSSLAGSLNAEQLSALILEQGTRASGASAGIMVEVVNNGRDVKTVASLGYPSSAVSVDLRPLAQKTPLSDAIRTKQAIWLGSHAEFAAQYPDLAEIRRGYGNEATVALPLVVDDRVLGALAFSFVETRDFLLEERGFLLALAQQCAQGLERVHAAEELVQSEQRFAGFMQHLPGLAWIKDAQGRYIFANDAAEKAFQVPRAELYGRTDAEVFSPPIADQFRRNDEQALLEGRGIQIVEELEHEDGSLHYSLVNKFPIIGSDGSVALIGGMAIDITERKQAEERLALLAQISELTRDTEDAEELMATVADVVGQHLQVKRCLFNEIDVENDIEVVHHDYHDGLDSVAGIHRVTEYSSITSAEMMQGITVVNNDSQTDPRTAEDYEQAYLQNGERSYVAVPLMRDGAWVASLWVSDTKPRMWSDEEVALLQTIAERTWTACEKLRIHGQLRDSEERLRVTFNMTAVGFGMLAPDTRFVDVNQAFCDIVGYTREELLTMNFDYLVHPDYVKSTRDNIRRLLRGKVSATMIEKLYIRKDGSQVWVQNSMSLVRDVDGDPLHIIVISQDITERKQIEYLQRSATESLLAAAEANAKYRTFFDQGSYFAGVMTLDGTLVEANRLSLEFCGYTRQDVIGKKFWDCGWWNRSPELMDMVRKGIQKALEGETFRRETNYYIADGSVRYVDLIIAPIKDESGRLLFLAPTGTDITERKQTEEELRHLNMLLEERVEKRTLQLETSDQLRRREMAERRQAQDRFAKSFNASPAAMSISRFEDGMYRNVNPKFIELLEYELEEIIGHTSLELKIYQNPQERAELLKTIRKNNGKWNYETHLSTKSGKSLDVSISVVEIELDAEPHLLSMITDITERNQMLTALRASEQQLRTLFDVLPVGVAYMSPERKVIDPNRTLERILGVPREALLSGTHKSLQYIRPDGSPMPESEFASSRALREGRTINNVETGIIKEGGQVIWTSVSATPISMPEPGVVVITVDVTDRKHMDDELRRSHRRFQMLSRRLVEIQEEERRTISRELHDRVGQSLAALNLNLSFLNNTLSGTSSLQVKSRIKDAIQLTEETVSTIRDVMADLRPPALDDYGLEAALNAFADTFSRRFGVRVTLMKPTIALPRFNPSIELTVLRIAQEALTNVAKHANATQASVSLALQNEMVYLTVEDNGDGIRSWQMANRPGSHGLKIMRERAETFGGTLQVHSFNKKGTRIEVKIPVRGNEQSTVRAEAD